MEQTSPLTSPLQEVSKDSLSELFARDPLELSDQDISRIVVELRAQRSKFIIKEAAAKAKPKKPKIDTAELDSLFADLGL